jgi:hypothetical protein
MLRVRCTGKMGGKIWGEAKAFSITKCDNAISGD